MLEHLIQFPRPMNTFAERKVLMEAKEKRLTGINLVISDWSGVISDDRHPVYEANMRVIESYGKRRVSFDEWLPATRMRPDEYFRDHGIVDSIDNFYEKYSTFLNQTRKEGIHPAIYSDVVETLQALTKKGFPIFVVSSHPKENLREEAREYGIDIFIADFLGGVIDKSEAVLALCTKMGTDPKQAVYLGDTIYDIQSAKAAGVNAIAVTTGYHLRERLAREDPDLVLDSFSALLDHL